MKLVSRPPSESPPPRIAALSVLPVFLDLTGERAVVAGGTPAAAWKAELLCAAGAGVDVYAPVEAVSEEMAMLAAREPTISLIRRRWRPADIVGSAVAVADAQGDEEAAAFAGAAGAAGVPCNVIDRPEHCRFQFGTIVNRSPVVVGISTSGAAPILGQAIRRRIETLLPRELADWAAFAKRWRDVISARLCPGPERRAFWEGFVDRAFGPTPQAASPDDLLREIAGSSPKGHVSFVGAGTGDAELLTLKAVRALQAADVVLFDDLVSDEVLELARREARRIPVGGRADRPACQRQEITEAIVKLAKAGGRVVRLTSGIPMIFERAGEEIAALEAEGIGCDIVPGITTGSAPAARLGAVSRRRDRAGPVRFAAARR